MATSNNIQNLGEFIMQYVGINDMEIAIAEWNDFFDFLPGDWGHVDMTSAICLSVHVEIGYNFGKGFRAYILHVPEAEDIYDQTGIDFRGEIKLDIAD